MNYTTGQICDHLIAEGDIEKMEEFIGVIAVECTKEDATPAEVALGKYFIGNLYSAIGELRNETWLAWQKDYYPPTRVKALNAIRQASALAEKIGFTSLLRSARANLGNELANQRRTIEALEYWHSDLSVNDDSAHIGSLATLKELDFISHYLEDPGHRACYTFTACRILASLVENVEKIDHPGILYDLKENPRIRGLNSLGKKLTARQIFWDSEIKEKTSKRISKRISKEEKYKRWSLKNKLFLNPLNDITENLIAAQDILQFPTHKVKILGGPYFPAAFSSIKRNFCFARFLAFEGFHEIHPEYEEKRLYLTDTLDHVNYHGYTEKLKTAFRIAFGIFDSLTMLIYKYFGHTEKHVAFTPSRLKEALKRADDNFFCTSLYWLSCDLYDIDSGKKSIDWKAPNPSFSDLRRIRNACEHEWLRVADSACNIWDKENDYAHIISLDQLKIYTLEVLKLSRSALLYFCLAVKFEETRKEDGEGFYPRMTTPII